MATGQQFDALFIYHKSDFAFIKEVAEQLEAKEDLKIWLEDWFLIPGESMQEELERAINDALYYVVFFGKEDIKSWQNATMQMAIGAKVDNPKKKVIPVLLKEGHKPEKESDLPQMLRNLVWVEFSRQDDFKAMHALLCGIKGISPKGLAQTITEINVNPFKGLEVFKEEDASFFFGREAIVQKYLGLLRKQRFLAVLGPSGSGKSSIVQAGMIPELRKKGVLLAFFSPKAKPIEELAFALLPLFDVSRKKYTPEELKERLKSNKESLHLMGRELVENTTYEKLIIVIDQFEEIFTQSKNEQEKRFFLAFLINAIEEEQGYISVIITMRSDFIGKCVAYPALNLYVTDYLEQVGPMNQEELKNAIEKPAALVNLEFENGLIDNITNDLEGSKSELPLLEHALSELYLGRNGNVMTFSTYKEIGGIEGALSKSADAVYQDLNDKEKEAIKKMFVLRLIQAGEGTEDTRKTALKKELLQIGQNKEMNEKLIQTFTDKRLLTSDTDAVRDLETIEVAHEALIRKWDKIQEWMAEYRELARILNNLQKDAEEYERYKDDSYLYAGIKLENIATIYHEYKDDLNKLEKKFIELSISKREREIRKKEEKKEEEIRLANENTKKQKRLFYTALFLGAFFFFAGLLAYVKKIDADIATIQQKVLNISYNAQTKEAKDPTIALNMAAWASKVYPSSTPIKKNLKSIVENNIFYEEWKEWEHSGDVSSVAFSPNGETILTAGGGDSTATLWDINGKELQVFRGHSYVVIAAVFSPNGNMVLTGSYDGTAKLWDLQGNELKTFNGHTDEVTSVAFSPDGERILTGSRDSTAKLWDLKGNEIQTFKGHIRDVTSVAFSPDGKTILSGSRDKTARIWDLEGKQLVVFKEHVKGVFSVNFSPDGKNVLIGSGNNTAKLWDLEGNVIKTFKAGNGDYYSTNSVEFSPNGEKILTSSSDQTVRLWDLQGNELHTLRGHTGVVISAAFSPDGSTVITGSWDKTAKLWDLKGNEIQTFKGHIRDVNSVAFSPDGKYVLTGSFDNTAKLWDLQGNELQTFKGHAYGVSSVAFSPDGKFVLTGNADKTAKLWDLQGNELQTLKGHSDFVSSVAFSPDGKSVLTGSYDNTAKLWDLQGNELQTLKGHSSSVSSVAFSPTGDTILTGSYDKTVRLWHIKGRELNGFQASAFFISSVAFSPDGKRILTGSGDKIGRLFNLQGKEIQSFKNQLYKNMSTVAYSPEGNKVLIGVGEITKLWNLKGEELITIKGHTNIVNSVAFSPDGRKVLTGSSDRTAKLWNTLESYIEEGNYGRLTTSQMKELGLEVKKFNFLEQILIDVLGLAEE